MNNNTDRFDILPTEYVPRSIDEFYGEARNVARRLMRSAEMCMVRNAPASHLFVGSSGSGKTALMQFALTAFAINPWNVHRWMGKDVTIDSAREIVFSTRLTSLYPGYRAWCIDEIDTATPDARARLLEIIGEASQPRGTVILATSNMPIEDFDKLEKYADARGRLSSRFQVHAVPGPCAEDVVALLLKWLPEKKAKELADTAGHDEKGRRIPVNCRAVLKDCLTVLQSE